MNIPQARLRNIFYESMSIFVVVVVVFVGALVVVVVVVVVDTNSLEHLLSARAAFNAFDVTGRGYIPSQDIKAALGFVLEKLSPDEQEDVYRHFK